MQTALALGPQVDRPWDAGDQALYDVTFCIVDLETTGGSPEDDRITEIGAVKVRGGEVIGEFATLVRPDREVPPAVTALTGITSSMVADAPTVGAVLPAFLEFSAGSVLVAHNAGFDMSFLRAACRSASRPWPDPVVVDTVRLARLLVPRDEVPNHRLATLAAWFGASTTPTHRALDDARATVDVLHALLGRLSTVATLGELTSFAAGATTAQQRRRHLARDVPHGPGVYLFVDATGRVLYVGSAGDLRSRVRSYFTRSEKRLRMAEMVTRAEAVRHVPCATLLEARVREVRLIASTKPAYNRRSRHPERSTWLVMTDEAIPRPALARSPGNRVVLAVFRTRSQASRALDALHRGSDLRPCTLRLRRGGGDTACVLGQVGRCCAPCVTGATPQYTALVADVSDNLLQRPGRVFARIRLRMSALTVALRFEEAAQLRDDLAVLIAGVARAQRLASLRRTARLVAAVRDSHGGWEIAHLVDGRLAGTASSPPGLHPGPTVDVLVATADIDPDQPALLDEADLVWQWLCRPGVRLVAGHQGWWVPAGAAASLGAASSGAASSGALSTGAGDPSSRSGRPVTDSWQSPNGPAGPRRARRRSRRGRAPDDFEGSP